MTDPTHSCDTCPQRRAPVSRRSITGLVGVSALGVPLLAACGGSSTSSDSTAGSADSDPGTTSSSAAGGGTSSSGALATTDEIDVGGGKIFEDAGVVVTQPTSGEFKAFSSTCTHQGCQVATVKDGTIDCPCHGSEFSIVDGSVEAGPAPKSLPEMKITVTGDQISLIGYRTGMAQHWMATRPGGLEVFELTDFEPPAPGPGEVTIRVEAAGVNPADYKHVARGDAADFPRPVGYEVAGVLSAIGPDTEIASGTGAVGDPVLAFRVSGGWSTELTVPAQDVFARPASLPADQAANLLLAGSTAAEMLHVTGVVAGETVLAHGASGAVGVSLLQQAALLDVRVIGTCSEARFDEVRRFGGEPVVYGTGLEQRVRELAPHGIAAALDCVGTDEAVDVSLSLVDDRDRIVTIAAQDRAGALGIKAIGGAMPASKAYRDSIRAHLIELAARGDLQVPMARTFRLDEAVEAAAFLGDQHPGGKLALVS